MELVIFKSPLMCVILGWILLLHVTAAVSPLLLKGKSCERAVTYAVSAVNLCLHGVIFTWALINSAPIDEILLVMSASCAVGLVSMGVMEAKLNKEKEEE